jgi:hypothetical protein
MTPTVMAAFIVQIDHGMLGGAASGKWTEDGSSRRAPNLNDFLGQPQRLNGVNAMVPPFVRKF